MMPWFGYIALIGVVPLGILIVRAFNADKSSRLQVLLAFSGAFLLGIAALHLIPEVYNSGVGYVGYFVVGGFLLQVLLDYLSGGLEHGHTHIHIRSIPYAAILGLCIHAFVEGVPLAAELHPESIDPSEVVHHDHGHHDHAHTHHNYGEHSTTNGDNSEDDEGSSQYPLLIALLIHKLPVAVALTGMLLGGGFRWVTIWTILGVFALAAPLGSFFGLQALGNMEYMMLALAVALGSFLHVSTTIIFESASDHKLNMGKLLAVLVGFGVAAITMEMHLH